MSTHPDLFARQRGLSHFGDEGQISLERASIAIVGLGGLGCPAAQYLAAAGAGSLTLIDDDHVSVTNLHRQILYTPDDVGRVKVEAAAEALARQAPQCRALPRKVRLTSANAREELSGHDVIVDGTDTMAARRLVEGVAHDLGVPVIWGAVAGWHGQVTVFDDTHRLDDVFPGPDPLDLDVCDGGAVFGPTCGQVGTMMAAEAVKCVAGAGTSLAGTLVVLDGRTGRWRDVALAAADSLSHQRGEERT
ncbi:HesA/MoeB/ThiF family protein [Demequina sediminicola]|uniref:HesA/MoeB/ThiF family protein n=1 Tax=Demequina sediminicola TaxID=1095026 RepID=UPI0007806072|nr:HesA/MoeB/ThiF family protein [Demequina sediminicola]